MVVKKFTFSRTFEKNLVMSITHIQFSTWESLESLAPHAMTYSQNKINPQLMLLKSVMMISQTTSILTQLDGLSQTF